MMRNRRKSKKFSLETIIGDPTAFSLTIDTTQKQNSVV